MIKTITVYCYDDRIEVTSKGKLLSKIYISNVNGDPIIVIPKSAKVHVKEDFVPLGEDVSKIDVEIRQHTVHKFFGTGKFHTVDFDKDGMPITLKATRTTSHASNNDQDVDSISSSESNRILSMILESLAKDPSQSSLRRAAETRRVAQACDVRVLQVAGVRAALTRGIYGNPDTLIAKKYAQLKLPQEDSAT